MLATEPKRLKPWLKALVDHEIESSMKHHLDRVDPVKSARFGVMSGALWLFAIALCITIGVFLGWQFSWLPPVFALPVQVLMTVSILKKGC
jgi:fatty acid desaturase